MATRMGRPVELECDGCRLFGMLHEAEQGSPRRDTGVVLLNAGPTDRSGPHRLYVKLARRLSALGYPVLRFDARAAGESEGEWDESCESGPVQNVFAQIQDGAWVADAKRAVDFMLERAGVGRVVLGGLCGGAVTGLLAAARHPDAAGVFMLGTPVTPSPTMTTVEHLPEAILERDARRYVRKLASPAAWIRFLSLKTDYRVLWGVLRSRVHHVASRLGLEAGDPIAQRLNSAFAESFRRATRRELPLLFVYAENDYLHHEFCEFFLPVFGKAGGRALRTVVIPDANHNLTEEAWQQAFYDALTLWLEGLGRGGVAA